MASDAALSWQRSAAPSSHGGELIGRSLRSAVASTRCTEIVVPVRKFPATNNVSDWSFGGGSETKPSGMGSLKGMDEAACDGEGRKILLEPKIAGARTDSTTRRRARTEAASTRIATRALHVPVRPLVCTTHILTLGRYIS